MLNRNTVFKLVASAVLATALPLSSAADDVTIKVKKRYLNLPVSHSQERGVMQLSVGGDAVRSFKIRLAPENPDYWVFCDISEFKGRKLTISYPGTNPGLKSIYQADFVCVLPWCFPTLPARVWVCTDRISSTTT